MGEAHLPAEQSTAQDEARLPSADADARREGDPQGAPGQGPGSPVGLIGRVHGRAAFSRFRTDARRYASDGLWCAAIVDPRAGRPHVAYAIGRKVGSAVRRNHIRRRLRQLVARDAPRWPAGWYLIGVRPDVVDRSYEELSEMLNRVLTRIELES